MTNITSDPLADAFTDDGDVKVVQAKENTGFLFEDDPYAQVCLV